jgi:hypothetical protein
VDTTTLERLEAPTEREAPMAPACEACGTTLAPNGSCLEVGECSDADADATRSAARRTAKYAAPRAWTVRGGVD